MVANDLGMLEQTNCAKVWFVETNDAGSDETFCSTDEVRHIHK